MLGKQAFFLALLVAICAAETYFGPAVPLDFDVQAISWNSCGGVANVTNINVDGCPSPGCTLKLYQRYVANFSMVTSNNHSSSIIAITATAGTTNELFRQNLTRLIEGGKNYPVSFPLMFDSKFATNRTENQIVRVSITGSTNNRLEVCRTFVVSLNSVRANSGTQYNQTCDFNNEPCRFENSLCSNNTCKCNGNSVENNKLCKIRVDKACLNSNDCLTNGECNSGWCKCRANYKPSTNGDQCSSSGTIISFSVLLLALQQMFVFLRK